ncbi:DUF4371 domain-containing protein [Trichonephila clavipes]|uniref:DUF4371 domain-containing protein n=1 Tax=Trichonephila clavipes TaxID=2585209 RepID=A0A8X6WE43_TRICX|nr:DUF4371 domain-containing protein [Trichonephila clavipes]
MTTPVEDLAHIIIPEFEKTVKSKRLQTKDYDLPTAMEFLRNCKDFFDDLRWDGAFAEMFCDAKELADDIDIPLNFEFTQPRHRARRKNVNFDYEG